MLSCFSLKSSASSSLTTTANQPTPLQGNSVEGTPRSSAQPSPTVNLTREYTLAVQTNSYNEIWSKIQVVEQWENNDVNLRQQLLEDVLQPNRNSIQEVLQHARPNTFTRLVSAYFDHSEQTCRHLLVLQHKVHDARSLYSPIHDLLDVLPFDSDSLTQSQCNWAYDVFLQFDSDVNPFPCAGPHNFHDMQQSFSLLKAQVDRCLHKSCSKVRCLRHTTTGSAVCVVGAAVGIALCAIAIASHALVTLVAIPFPFLPSRLTKRELAHMAQLEAAGKSAYVLHNDLDTIDRLVARLCTAVEGDKLLVRLGLARGKDKHPIYEVLKQLRKNHVNVLHQLIDLEEHICLCFAAINRARSLLLEEIHLHQTNNL
ncbi:hypothetical protein Ancab_034208 [Ancistrocladus abbreviatus]